MKAYDKALKAISTQNPINDNIETGYAEVEYVYAAAKKIGFSKLTPASLLKFSNTVKNFHFPLG